MSNSQVLGALAIDTSESMIINGAMGVSQRGTIVVASGSGSYLSADRFLGSATGASMTASVGAGPTGFPYATNLAGASGLTAYNFGQRIESYNIAPLVGQLMCFSAYYYVSAGTSLQVQILVPSARDNYTSAASTTIYATNPLPVAQWIRVAVPFIVPSGASNGLAIFAYFTNTAAAAANTSTTGWQLDIGSLPKPFRYRRISKEFSDCQRYYFVAPSTVDIGITLNNQYVYRAGIALPVTMRATPTCSASSFSVGSGSAGTPSPFNITTNQMCFYNTAANWTVGVGISVNGATANAEI
jgi:hypothetical protein